MEQNFITIARTAGMTSIEDVVKCMKGIGYACSKKVDKESCRAITDKDSNTIMIMRCTNKQYKRFSVIVEELYPGLCDFDF